MTAPIPVTVLTGFLGAGKTTLLNRLLADPAMAGTLAIINEFGEIGLDHLFVEVKDEGLVLLSSGCLCCTVRGDLIDTLVDVAARRRAGALAFDRVVIETTGLADPAPVLQAILAHPGVAQDFVLDGVVTVVDAANGEATLDAHPEAVKQVAVADRLVVTKTDLVTDAAARERLARRLKRLAPMAKLLVAAAGEATPAALAGLGPFDPSRRLPDVAGWLQADLADDHSGHGHAMPGDGQDAADVNRHDEAIQAFCLTTDRPVPSAALDLFLELLPSAHGPKLLRLKGIVQLADAPDRPLVLHAVQHVVHPPVFLPRWPSDDHRTRLVFITRDLDRSFVERLWSAFVGAPSVDTPDRAALLDNPLALPRGNR